MPPRNVPSPSTILPTKQTSQTRFAPRTVRNESSTLTASVPSLRRITTITTQTSMVNHSPPSLKPHGAMYHLHISPHILIPARRWHMDPTTPDHPIPKRREAITRITSPRYSTTPIPTPTRRSTRPPSNITQHCNLPHLPHSTPVVAKATCNNNRWTTYTRTVIPRRTTTGARIL